MQRPIRSMLALCCAGMLTACASLLSAPAPAPRPESLFDDASFAPASTAVSAAPAMAISEPMRLYLREQIGTPLGRRDLRRALFDALYAKGQLQLDYDSAGTRTAAQAFDARAGNCLSLALMTAAFARELGLPVRFQSVAVQDGWSRSAGLVFNIGHINLALGRVSLLNAGISRGDEWLVIDFLPVRDPQRARRLDLDEAQVLAMYLNNKAAEALADGLLDDAYWWARAAVLQDPRGADAYNTLGVIFSRHRQPAEAERAFRVALGLDPDKLSTLDNLAGLLARNGRADEARVYAEQARRRQPVAPFAAFEAGLQALREGRPRDAQTLFKQELERTDDFHEVHFWLAIADLRLGDQADAIRHLQLAADHSPTREQHAIYAAKLERLTAQGVR